jgi:hypothetical protein
MRADGQRESADEQNRSNHSASPICPNKIEHLAVFYFIVSEASSKCKTSLDESLAINVNNCEWQISKLAAAAQKRRDEVRVLFADRN